ncbi:hypothetical protein PF001_g25606 [Phytophthora fragariae]|uniref:Uncharacterized protein n=1 Tax=Phytophthora fragariae TaxID=53985 RepID=A0A6A4BSB3_9STRA|nr:hypothetical protein PF001_g25606 [Phytophthora fragariae]
MITLFSASSYKMVVTSSPTLLRQTSKPTLVPRSKNPGTLAISSNDAPVELSICDESFTDTLTTCSWALSLRSSCRSLSGFTLSVFLVLHCLAEPSAHDTI